MVASICEGIGTQNIAFENHLNVFQSSQKGMSQLLAHGLSAYLNSSIVDTYFRQFNGSTQVNSSDLRSLPYPNRKVLENLGRAALDNRLSGADIDNFLLKELLVLMEDLTPLHSMKKVQEALDILSQIAVPKAQINQRSALVLLALAKLEPEAPWERASDTAIGITPVLHFIRDFYGRTYAPNTRETIRKETMHQFVEAGIVACIAEEPDRPVNSPNTTYSLKSEFLVVLKAYGSDRWNKECRLFLDAKSVEAEAHPKKRASSTLPFRSPLLAGLRWSAGQQSQLIRSIIDEFAPRFMPTAEIVYIGDTTEKMLYVNHEHLSELHLDVDWHGKMPDVVLYWREKAWLILVECVTSHGPIDPLRRTELENLFDNPTAQLVFLTSFTDREAMRKYLPVIAWETEVWCADSPTHLIHFDGDRFFGPY